jgi:hypothetical protein
MSQQPPTDSGSGPAGWTPPSGWSPEQPPAWPAPPAQAQPGATPPPPPPPGYPGQPSPVPPGYPHAGGPPGYPPPSYPPGYPPPGYPPAAQSGGWGQPQHPWTPPPQAPKPGIVPLRPLGIGELLDGALGLIRSNPKTVLGLAAVISSVSALVQTLGIWISLEALGAPTTIVTGDDLDATADLVTLATAGVAQLIPALVAGFLQVLASGLFIVLVAAAVLGRRLDAARTWDLLKPRLLPLIGLTVLLGVGLVAALGGLVAVVVVLLVAGGQWAIAPAVILGVAGIVVLVYVYVRLSVASPALVIEGLGPIASIRRSWRLVRGSWWRVLGILLLSAIITNLLSTVVSVPITMVASLATGVSDSLLPTVLAAGIATLVAGIITLPFSAAVTGLLYTDLRMRREALDIQLTSAGVSPSADPLEPYRRARQY